MEQRELRASLLGGGRRGKPCARLEQQFRNRRPTVEVDPLQCAAPLEHRTAWLPEGTRLLGTRLFLADG